MAQRPGSGEATAPAPGAAPGPSAAESLRWASSAGTGAPRNREALLRLHRARFVEGRGHQAALDLIEERRQEGCRRDAELKREHLKQTRRILEASAERIKNMEHEGSFSYRSRAEQEAVAARRFRPEDAVAKFTEELRDKHRSFKQEKGAMTQRVAQRPNMTLRSKEDVRRWEEARQDPKEAKEAMAKHTRSLQQQYQAERGAMTARVETRPRHTFRTKEQRAALEASRPPAAELQSRLERELKDRAGDWRRQLQDMSSRLAELPAMSFRTKEERDVIEELRQDPEEAAAAVTQHMQQLQRTWKETKAEMMGRVQASPRQTFWTREERERIEEARQDPDEARERTAREMRELARAYRAERQGMLERVAALPRKTFMDPETRRQRAFAATLRTLKPARDLGEAA